MRKQLFLAAVSVFFSIPSFSQKVSYKDLIGTWVWDHEDPDNKGIHAIASFIDSVHLTEGATSSLIGDVIVTKYSYTLSYMNGTNLLFLKDLSNQFPYDSYSFFKLSGDRLEMQECKEKDLKTFKWDTNPASTMVYHRRTDKK